MGVGAVLPLGAVLPPQLPPLVPQNPTRKTSFSNRGGSSPEALRYYGRRSQAVLPFGERYYCLERYYRSESGTTAEELQRYYRFESRYYRWGRAKRTKGKTAAPMKRKENDGCDMDVYVLIPPKSYQSGSPLDSTVTPTRLEHQQRNEGATPS